MKSSEQKEQKGLPKRCSLMGGDQRAVTPTRAETVTGGSYSPILCSRGGHGAAHTPLPSASNRICSRSGCEIKKLLENCSLSWESRHKAGEKGVCSSGGETSAIISFNLNNKSRISLLLA